MQFFDQIVATRRGCLAFPYRQYLPTRLSQALLRSDVSFGVPLDLAFPEQATGLGQSSASAGRVSVPMPITTVNENDLLARAKHKVGLARQITAMKAVSISKTVHQFSNNHFRCGVAMANKRHHATARWIDILPPPRKSLPFARCTHGCFELI